MAIWMVILSGRKNGKANCNVTDFWYVLLGDTTGRGKGPKGPVWGEKREKELQRKLTFGNIFVVFFFLFEK